MRRLPLAIRSVAALLCLWLLAGCPAQLAPSYDKAVADGLNTVSAEAMTLLASAAGSTTAATFSTREAAYNSVIGKLDALAISAGARPVPKNKVTDTINQLLDKRKGKPLDPSDDGMPASVHPIQKVSETLAFMRDTDKKQGLTAKEVTGFKGQVQIYLDQAITYENFLER